MSVVTPPGTGESESHGVPIAVASQALHVPMPTLRSWELRYGIPESDRPPGKHRRYTEPEMHALRLMRDEIARGTRASVAAKSVRTLLGVAGPAGELIQHLLEASNRLDTDGIRAQLTKATDVLGLDGCIDEVMLPAMRQIGQWWMAGRCDLSQEQLTTEAARAWLDKRSAFAPTPTAMNPIILACGPGDLHTIGLEALALLLRHRGWPCRVLGARVPTESLTTASVAAGAAGVVIVAHLPTGRRRALASITAVHERGIPVFWAGNAFSTRRSRAQIPGSYLGVRLQDAADLVVATLSRDGHR
ncbi:B12-binding domain-containing protein [Nakamurella sp. PAMC28650]|jgi:methanogenic corrinoid protein MtbC1|uniref:MerR family transcriptional regulator n=1 Tax=Nakamurella sp. PAMC28650 TaxID=2762325 RepID=UPI00164CEB19|nr:B12-binding domain-containing protein [Nakamurella sp. PAMC28650]QNK79492.1 cobalamin B12-binding domain-containing protein [Nakamurella sp. PAMC28650]